MAGNDVLTRLLKVATGEMLASSSPEVTPAHILIALSRLSEDQPSSDGCEYGAELRGEFESLGIEPRRFRRRIRALLPGRPDGPRPESARLSQSAQTIFVLAEALAQASSEQCGATHLLRATFVFLSDIVDSTNGGQPGLAGGVNKEIPYEL